METGRFDRITQVVKLHKNFAHFKYSRRVNKKRVLGEYLRSLSQARGMNKCVSKRPVGALTIRWAIWTSKQVVTGSTPVGSPRIFSSELPVSLTENHLPHVFTKLKIHHHISYHIKTRSKVYTQFHFYAYRRKRGNNCLHVLFRISCNLLWMAVNILCFWYVLHLCV